MITRVDHLVYAVPDLSRGIAKIETLVGVRPSPGGAHPGRGTRNALVSLGPGMYLEIVGPDPDQPPPHGPRWFGIDELVRPRVVTWAASGANLDETANAAALRGLTLGAVTAGSRRRADGVLLTWMLTSPHVNIADGVVPFLIDWGSSQHPSATAAPGATLRDFRAEHPDANRVAAALGVLGIDLPVTPGPKAALIATIDGPYGRVEIS
jgi:hypothetical protein